MPASADVNDHLDRSHGSIRDTFLDWSRLSPTADRTDMIEAYFQQANVGDTRRLGSSSVMTSRERAGSDAPKVFVLSSHDVSQLAPAASALPSAPGDVLRGPGTGSQLGALMAVIEGLKSTVMAGNEFVNLTALSVGADDDAIELAERYAAGADLVIMTESVAWSTDPVTVTTGSRGRLEATITISAPAAVHDAAYAGAALNPLNRLVELLAGLRDDKGRISLPDFYARAQRPDREMLRELASLPWLDRIGGAAPTGSLSPIERATQWPVVNLLDVSDTAADASIPQRATGRLAIYLVPDQRPVDVERSLRSWLAEQVPDSLELSLRIDHSARPYLLDDQAPAAKALQQAIKRVHGRRPIIVPAGGAVGAGEIHYATTAPVLFLGLSGPMERWGTSDEALPRERFDQGVAVAAELCQQLARVHT